MAGALESIRRFPQVEKSAAMLWLDRPRAAAVSLRTRRHVPFADVIRRVSGLAQLRRQRRQILPQRLAVPPYARLGCIAACDQHRPRGRTYRLIRHRAGKIRAARSQRVEIRRVRGTVQPIRAYKIPAKLVGVINDNVRPLSLGTRLTALPCFRPGMRHGSRHACLCGRGCRAQKKSTPIHFAHCSFPSPDLPLPLNSPCGVAGTAPVYML